MSGGSILPSDGSTETNDGTEKPGERVQRLKVELASCRQRGSTIEEYYGKMMSLWTCLADHRQAKNCGCPLSYDLEKEDRLHEFLMGLDESVYGAVKSNLLSRDPLPSLDEAYSILIQAEDSKKASGAFEDGNDTIHNSSPSNVTMSREDRQRLVCSSCGASAIRCSTGNPTTGVLWDLHTCPVPDDVDPRHVRASIESALEKEFGGRRPVTVFAVGNLDFVPRRVLEEISSSGIFLRHAVLRAVSVLDILHEWERDGRHTHVLLISGDNAWFNKAFYSMGFNILRALPLPRPPPFPTYHPHTKARVYPTYPNTKEWFWESLLEANSGALQTSSEVIFKDEPACSCNLCDFRSRSCDAFINHLQSSEHREEAYTVVERKYEPLNSKNYEALLFCKVCNYTGHYHRDMDMHYKSEEHSQRAQEKNSTTTLEEENSSKYPLKQKSELAEEEECMTHGLFFS